MVAHNYNPSTEELEAGKSDDKGPPLLHDKFKNSLGYMKPNLKININK